MEVYRPLVKDISLFQEIVKNLIDPLEVTREAISNSVDAEAKNINIEIYRDLDGVFCISFTDDGCGMNKNELESFFNLGDSRKDKRNIGEKGLGTKIFFKSRKITVITQKNNSKRLIAEMKEPWFFLINNEIPTYTIETEDSIIGKDGTKIIIEGYLVDNPEKYYNLETIKDYILWFTAGGSFKNIFATYPELNCYVKNMQVAPRIFINDCILDIREEIAGAHQFFPPQENPLVDNNEKIYERSVNYCRHFGPYHRSTNINGEYVSFQMYGTVSGVNCRKSICKLRQSERLKGRFGIYLAKDFIPFTKKSSLISDPNYHHFHILVNSQNFELTADRNNVSNDDDPKVKWIYLMVKEIINNDILPSTQSTYFKMRKQEEINFTIKEKSINLKQRIKDFSKLENLNLENISIKRIPDNEAQVALLLSALLSNPKFKRYINIIDSIAHYSLQSTTDLICLNNEGETLLVEIEYLLSNLFKHEHPYMTFDCIVCWKVDLEINDRKTLVDGIELKLCFEKGQWLLKYGTEKIIPIIELSSVINFLINDKNKQIN
ncbi:ATP-binding protein [Clostridium sp. Sa3CUN1]|uniref:ATP-binding protein n=1 Tax=Clostridium gallinarum TaxID=2762246 RepID=A0ABR8Q0J5_9CLOT|nr:ATP-binding protein [Clostridium gallinarum]MBD7913940.1 ATP-binding protein [Clostridium gallinarum]